MHSLWHDLRYSTRALAKKPGFTAMAVLSLALGIGANAAIFSLLDAVLLKALPVRHPEQLFFVEPNGGPQFKRSSKISFPAYENIRAHNDSFSGVCFFSYITRISTQVNGQAEMAETQMVSDSFFSVLGVDAIAGRMFIAGDDRAEAETAFAVISYAYWQQRFAGSTAAVGQVLTINGTPFTIVGVAPPEFYGTIVGGAPEIFLPSSAERFLPERFHSRDYSLPFVLGRLRPGVSEAQAASRVTMLVQQSDLSLSGSDDKGEKSQEPQKQTFRLEPARQGFNMLRQQFSASLRLLMALVGLVLLIACTNVANLLMARIASRRKEIAVRLALGASRFRIMQSLFTESLLLAVLGGAVGLLLASWSTGLILKVFSSGRNPISINTSLALSAPLDWRVLTFTVGISLLSALLFGMAPAWSATRASVTDGLKDRAASAGGAGQFRWGRTLVIGQVALSVVLMVGAGLFVRSLAKLRSVDVGFRPENVLVFSVDPELTNYQATQIRGLYMQMAEKIGAIPGVKSASFSRQGLLGGGGTYGSIRIPGHPLPADEGRELVKGKDIEPNLPSVSQVGPRFFETLGMTLVRGRDFGPQDTQEAPAVAVINETFARYYFGAEDPIGQYFDPGTQRGRLAQIVGVVRDAKAQSVREQTQRTYYVPFLQDPGAWRETTFQLRTLGDPLNLVTPVRSEIQSINPNLAIFRVRTLEAQVDESLGQERLVTTLASLFGVLAMVLASAGLFGLLSYSVNQRTQEIGIRMALGARAVDVLRLIVGSGMWLAAIGVVIGLAGAFGITRLMASLLFGVSPTDLLTFVFVSAGLLIVALLACYLPARRAMKVDPLIALRYE